MATKDDDRSFSAAAVEKATKNAEGGFVFKHDGVTYSPGEAIDAGKASKAIATALIGDLLHVNDDLPRPELCKQVWATTLRPVLIRKREKDNEGETIVSDTGSPTPFVTSSPEAMALNAPDVLAIYRNALLAAGGERVNMTSKHLAYARFVQVGTPYKDPTKTKTKATTTGKGGTNADNGQGAGAPADITADNVAEWVETFSKAFGAVSGDILHDMAPAPLEELRDILTRTLANIATRTDETTKTKTAVTV
jgi:hypothetical protein